MTNFVVDITYNGKTEEFDIGEWEEFPEAARQAGYFLEGKGIKEYSVNYLKAESGEYEGQMVRGENIESLFITENEILKGLRTGKIAIGYENDSVTAYMADNYFYFDSDYMNETPENLSEKKITELYLRTHTPHEIAKKIHECLDEFVVEFPMEYWLYKLCLTDDNREKSIKIEQTDLEKNERDKEACEKLEAAVEAFNCQNEQSTKTILRNWESNSEIYAFLNNYLYDMWGCATLDKDGVLKSKFALDDFEHETALSFVEELNSFCKIIPSKEDKKEKQKDER